MSLSVWPDWLKILVFTMLWALVGAVALDTFPGYGSATAVGAGWVISYVALMGAIALGEKNASAAVRAFFMSLGVMTIVSYSVAVMTGVAGGTF